MKYFFRTVVMLFWVGMCSWLVAGGDVVLVHGLMDSPLSMVKIGRALKKEGFEVHYFYYPSTLDSIKNQSARLHAYLLREKLQSSDKISLVGHSLGGVVILEMISLYQPENVSAIVLIASPVQGSQKADFWSDKPPVSWLYGPALQELAYFSHGRTPFYSIPEGIRVGVISGVVTSFLDSRMVAGRDDGVVGLEETWFPAADDSITISGQHTLLLFKDETARQVVAFLKFGRFLK